MSGIGRKLVVCGIDPGEHSLGICVLTDGFISETFQKHRTAKERQTGTTREWIQTIVSVIENNDPQVCGLEGTQHQPWRAKGHIPKGMVALERQIDEIQNEIAMRAIVLYRQSPSIQSQYPDEIIRRMIRQSLGTDFEPLPHLISATKHALYAESMYKAAQARRRGAR